MDAPTLTLVERLTLANQYKILAALSEDNAAGFARNAEILLRGHVGLYHHVFDGVSEEVPTEVTDEVQDILDMFWGIHIVFAERPQSEIKAAGLDRKKLTFNGFDANNDPHYEQARFMVERLDLYQELKGGNFNSHSRMDMSRYRRMLPIYQAAFKSKEGLTVETLKAMQEAV